MDGTTSAFFDDSNNRLSASNSSASLSNVNPVVEDEIDLSLSRKDGRIEQPRTPNCQHKSNTQKCLYCTPKEPYDEEHLEKEGIKHMSFHSYLRKVF